MKDSVANGAIRTSATASTSLATATTTPAWAGSSTETRQAIAAARICMRPLGGIRLMRTIRIKPFG
jgi:hypothetical protein